MGIQIVCTTVHNSLLFCSAVFYFRSGEHQNQTIYHPGGGLPYITDGDARRNFQKKPLKVTILGVAPANFIL